MKKEKKTPQKALDYLTRSIAKDPTLPIYFFQRGVIYHELDKLQDAVIDYSEALRVFIFFLLFLHFYSIGFHQMFSKDEKFINFKEEQLSFTLTRQQVLYNRAVAFCGLQLYHRAKYILGDF